MKERSIFITVIVVLIIAIVGVLIFKNQPKETKVVSTDVKTFTYLPNLTQETFQQKIDNGESFAVFIWRPDCGDSQKFITEFKKYFVDFDGNGNFERVRYNLGDNFYSFDISTIIPSMKNTALREQFKDQYGFYYTPSLVYYEDTNHDGKSEVKNIAEWDPVYGFNVTDYLQWFYDNGLITPYTEVYHTGSSDEQSTTTTQ